MKTTVMCSLITVAAMGAGIGVGWLLWGERTETRTAGRIPRAAAPVPAAAGGNRAPTRAQEAREQTAAMVAAELEKMKTLSVEEFAGRMVDAWLSDRRDPDTHVRKALYLSACDADRGMAFWRQFTRRKGLRIDEDMRLQDFFQVVAYRDGKRFMEMLKEVVPGGPLNGVGHGWALAAPEEAVEWINALPEGSPVYDSVLQGMMWGLAEKSPATALYAYERLRPNDQNYHTALNVSLSTMRNYGMKGLNELVAGVKDEAQRRLLLSSAMDYLTSEPPGEFVKWMAEPLETAPYLRGNFDQMASRWVTNAPEEAMEWLGQNALRSGGETALSVVAASLVKNGKGGELAAWLAANPNAPGQAAVVSGKSTAGAVR